MTYAFTPQLKKGQQGETAIANLFRSLGWEVTLTEMSEQRKGIDMWVEKEGRRRTSLEIKTDERSWKTGNAFIETISVDTQNKAGWAYTSQADWLLYHLPQGRYFYMVRMSWLRSQLPLWEKKMPRRQIPNKSYKTHGLLLPINTFEQQALDDVGLPKDLINCLVINY